MLSPEDFLLTLYVLVDDFCHRHPELVRASSGKRGPQPKLSPAEVVTMIIFAQWERFSSGRGFWRFAEQRLRPLFPTLPDRTQFNRAARRRTNLVAAFFQDLAAVLGTREAPYEIIDRFGMATRRSGRRGVGWLEGYTDKGLCSRLGFFHGVHILSAISPAGVITGLGVGRASTKDQPMAEALFEARLRQDPSTPAAGQPAASQIYLGDKGFSGPNRHREWYLRTGALLLCPPQKGHAPEWPVLHRRAIASMRQMVETVHEKLLNRFRLQAERPHHIDGLLVRLYAKAALHNACIWINGSRQRPLLAFAALLRW
ncbi:MAG TPA: hypothetical protein VGB66_04160 [Longimicrobium sp.]|jgi:hypothetical protein